jgi:hypothetical protein
MKLTDSVIVHVAKLLQLSMLTGTDIVDHMRMISLTEREGFLFLDEDYEKMSEQNIIKMLKEVESIQSAEF